MTGNGLWLNYNNKIHVGPKTKEIDVRSLLKTIDTQELIIELNRRGKAVVGLEPYKAMLAELAEKPILAKLYEVGD